MTIILHQSLEWLVAREQYKVVDYLTSLAQSILHESGIIYCKNSSHWDSDNQEDHEDETNCIYYAMIAQICRDLCNY